jgi:signal transduction histidine kinase/CheY-like chemotaxis protein
MQPASVRPLLLFVAAWALVSALAFPAAALWLAERFLESLEPEAAAALGVALALASSALVALAVARRLSAALAGFAEGEKTAAGREKAARAAERAKDEFFATLGHELRNPLAVLAAAAHILRRKGPAEGPMREAALVVDRQVEQMTRLVEDLLDLSRVIRGKLSLSRQPLDLAAALERALGELRASGRLARHRLTTDLAPVAVRADEARVAQIIANLVGNAAKYTPDGGTIRVSLRRERDTAILRVHDSGVGMPAELAARVFDLFVQGDVVPGQAPHGLGVGLALVKHLAELHGGKAFAASAGPGQGSVFTVTLPAIEAAPEPRADAPRALEPAARSIVLVEDDEDTRQAMRAALSLDGHKVHEAADGPAGISAVAALKPDAAVIDIALPGLSGYQIASALRGSPARDKMVLVAMTGYGSAEAMRQAMEAGFDEYVTKPIAPERLVRLIDAALARKRAY